MVLGSTVKMLARQVPNYHLVSHGIARNSLTICTCKTCRFVKDCQSRHLVCTRVADKVDDDGYAIVAVNGTCDRAEFAKEKSKELVLES